MQEPECLQSATEAGVIAGLVKPEIKNIGGKPFAIFPHTSPVLIEEALRPPHAIEQLVDIQNLLGLREFIQFHAATATTSDSGGGRVVIFAEEAESSIRAIFDYHGDSQTPARVSNRAAFSLAYDNRYLAWSAAFNHWLPQSEFVDLLESNESSLVQPPPSEMLSLAANLEINQSSKVVARTSSRNGTGEIRFETAEGENSTKIPETIQIGVPIYKGLTGEGGRLKAWIITLRVRYRISNGSVKFQLVPLQLDDVLDGIWRELVDTVRTWGPQVIEGSLS